MEHQPGHTQITFHYINGQTESFDIHELAEEAETQQQLRQEVRRFLERTWWIFNLPEQTVIVNMKNVLKVELKPPMPELHGEGVFPDAERMTALNSRKR